MQYSHLKIPLLLLLNIRILDNILYSKIPVSSGTGETSPPGFFSVFARAEEAAGEKPPENWPVTVGHWKDFEGGPLLICGVPIKGKNLAHAFGGTPSIQGFPSSRYVEFWINYFKTRPSLV